jgi:hypothetical protein
MATMTQRATFSLDEGTVVKIRKMAALWNVSQAEVVRRSIASAEQSTPRADPASLLQQLHAAGGGLEKTTAEAYLAELAVDRREWRTR